MLYDVEISGGNQTILKAMADTFIDLQLISGKLKATGITAAGVKSMRQMIKSTNQKFSTDLRIRVTTC